ncbi:MAG: hypothetical protein PHQ22_10080 [Sulfuricurvum sp.]|nr:hypothetical protein [Sulfuricurvum sp.]MDD5387527.1 hypothetical protein [Sulfuricurvum sp.]
MHLEMLASSTGEVWLIGVLFLIGVSFLLFGKGLEMIFVGIVVLGGITAIAYSNHSNYLDERFTLQRFNEGRALSCGMWRGEGVRVDLSQGWVKEKGVGFVKGDVIVNDIGVCRVIGEKTPEPSSVPYWMAFVSTLAILLTLRAVTLGVEEEDHDTRAE